MAYGSILGQTPELISNEIELSSAAQSALGLSAGATLDDALSLLGEFNIIIASRAGTGSTSFTVTFSQKPQYVFWLGELDSQSHYSNGIVLFTPGVDEAGTSSSTCNLVSTNSGNKYSGYRQWSSDGLKLTLSANGSSWQSYINSSDRTYYYAYIV